MKIKDILKYENKNSNSIFLFKEGLFYRAYNLSAMRYVQNISKIKIIARYIKYLKQEIIFCGFPETSFEKIKNIISEKNYIIEEIDKKQFKITGINIENENFEDWKKVYPIKRSIASPSNYFKEYQFIIKKLKNFPVIEKTPFEAVEFISDIQEIIEMFKI